MWDSSDDENTDLDRPTTPSGDTTEDDEENAISLQLAISFQLSASPSPQESRCPSPANIFNTNEGDEPGVVDLSLFATIATEIHLKIWKFVAMQPRVLRTGDVITRVPAVLQVNREARAEALKQLKLTATLNRKPVYTNPEHDILFFRTNEKDKYPWDEWRQQAMRMCLSHFLGLLRKDINGSVYKDIEHAMVKLDEIIQVDFFNHEVTMATNFWDELRRRCPKFNHLLVIVPHDARYMNDPKTWIPWFKTLGGYVKQAPNATYTNKQEQMRDFLLASLAAQHRAGKSVDITFLKSSRD